MDPTVFFNNLMRMFGVADPANRDGLLLFMLALCVLALYAAMTALFMIRKRHSSAEMRNLRMRLQELSLMVEDHSGRISAGKVKIDKRTLYLEEKIKILDALEKQVRKLSKKFQGSLDDATSYLEDRVYGLERAIDDMSRGKSPEIDFEDDDDDLEIEEEKTEEVEPMVLALEESEEEEDGDHVSLLTALNSSRSLFSTKFKQLVEQQDELGDRTFYAGLQDLLVNSGVGDSATSKLLEKVKLATDDSPTEATQELLRTTIEKGVAKLVTNEEMSDIEPKKVAGLPKVIVVVGSEGSGKTSFVARLGRSLQKQGGKVLVCSSSSTRAEDEVPLEVLAKKLKVHAHSEPISVKPKSVAYKALHHAQDQSFDVLIVDTIALDSRGKSLAEIESVVSMISREQPNSPHEVILTVTTSAGEDSVKQRDLVRKKMKLTGVCVTKLDVSKRAGKLVAITSALDLPIRYVSFGTSATSLEPFSAAEFSYALFYDNAVDFSVDEWEGAPA